MKGTLYLVATPIGNRKDITLRALEVLSSVDLIAAEDTRVTIKLLSFHGIRRPLTSFHDHSPPAKLLDLLQRMSAGGSVALVTDSGTPLISDPGFPLVRAAIEQGIRVEALPGPSSLIAALILSGLASERFVFEGYLPQKESKRKKAIERLVDEERTILFFESPHRIEKTLAALLEILGDRNAALIRELTKKFEETLRGRFSWLLETLRERPRKGEMVLVVEGKKSCPPPLRGGI